MILRKNNPGQIIPKINPLPNKILADQLINIGYEYSRNGNLMFLSIIPIIDWKDMNTGKKYEITRGKHDFELITDGQISTNELYSLVEYTIIVFKNVLSTVRGSAEIYPMNIVCPPQPVIEEGLQFLVDWFHGNL